MGKLKKSKLQVTKGGGRKPTNRGSFRVQTGGGVHTYEVRSGFGYFIPAFKTATNLTDVAATVEEGIKNKDVAPVIEFFGLKADDVAKAASVSPRTVTRWTDETIIGAPGSAQFFKMDEIIKKGVELFGGEEPFKAWLDLPNGALGTRPIELVTSPVGVEQVEDAIEALHFGNVI